MRKPVCLSFFFIVIYFLFEGFVDVAVLLLLLVVVFVFVVVVVEVVNQEERRKKAQADLISEDLVFLRLRWLWGGEVVR